MVIINNSYTEYRGQRAPARKAPKIKNENLKMDLGAYKGINFHHFSKILYFKSTLFENKMRLGTEMKKRPITVIHSL